jgi:hypothetical protein
VSERVWRPVITGITAVAAPAAREAPDQDQRATATAARWVVLGLALFVLISDNLLVSIGYPYNVPLGPFPAKIHPGTYAITLGFLRLLVPGNPVRQLAALAAAEPAAMGLWAAVVAVAVLSILRYGPSGSAFLIDTYLSAAMLTLVLVRAGDRWIRLAFGLVVGLIALNAAIGCLQPFGQWRLVPYLVGGDAVIEPYFRANALGGHPLTNAFRTAMVALAVPARPGRARTIGLLAVLLLGLLAFGGRTALVVTVVLLLGWGVVALTTSIVHKTMERHAALVMAVGVPLGLSALVLVALGPDLGARVLGTLYWDDSADSRLLVFRIFDYIDTTSLILGISPEGIDQLLFYLRSTTTVYYIENGWLWLLLQFGFVGFGILVPPLLWLLGALARRGGTPTRLVVLAFLVICSSNNTLATKTQDFALLMAVLLGTVSYWPAAGRHQHNGGPDRSPTRRFTV